MRIAVLGCGSIGRRHLRNLRTLGEANLMAFDPSGSAREQVATEADVPTTSNLDDIWAFVPSVVLVTAPPRLHLPLALEAARRNCHLFVEKPLAHTSEGMESLLAEVDQRGLRTMVGCNMRFHPGPSTVDRLLREGSIGAPLYARLQTGSYLPRWRPWQDYRQSYSASTVEGGAILDCIHEIDLSLWLLGPAHLEHAVRLPAQAIGLETDGLAELLLRHQSGLVSSVHLNFIQRDYRRCIQVIGTEGTLYWDFEQRAVYRYDATGTLASAVSEPAGWESNQMYLDEMNHFIGCIRTEQMPMSPLTEGLAALAVAEAARRMPA